MSISTSGSTRKCATCDFFGGARKTNSSGSTVTYEQKDPGHCNERNKEVTTSDSCSRWEKWGQLK